MAYPNPPKTWSAAAVLTAAQMNAELRDALNIIIPTASTTLAWASYTPTLTQSGAVTKTVTYAKYFQVGKIVVVNVILAVTGAGTANNAVVVGLPVTASGASNKTIGDGYIFNASAGTVPGSPFLASTTTVQFVDATQITTVSLGQTGSAFSEAFANTDSVTFFAVYEAA